MSPPSDRSWRLWTWVIKPHPRNARRNGTGIDKGRDHNERRKIQEPEEVKQAKMQPGDAEEPVTSMSQAIRVALRHLLDTPVFTAIALVSLAFGTGLNILIFSFTSPVLFKAMPYPEPDRLLDVSMAPPGRPDARGPLTPPLYILLRDRTSAAFEAVGVFDTGRSANLAGDA